MEPSTGIQETTAPLGLSEVTVVEARGALASTPGLPFTLGIIPSSVHGFFDYVLGAGAIAVPWLFGFPRNPAARRALQIPSAIVLLYSVFTNDEWGLVRIIRFPTHLLLDVLGGTFLLAAPRLFGFRRSRGLFTTLGLAELAIALLSRRYSGTER